MLLPLEAACLPAARHGLSDLALIGTSNEEAVCCNGSPDRKDGVVPGQPRWVLKRHRLGLHPPSIVRTSSQKAFMLTPPQELP